MEIWRVQVSRFFIELIASFITSTVFNKLTDQNKLQPSDLSSQFVFQSYSPCVSRVSWYCVTESKQKIQRVGRVGKNWTKWRCKLKLKGEVLGKKLLESIRRFDLLNLEAMKSKCLSYDYNQWMSISILTTKLNYKSREEIYTRKR